MQLRCDCSGMCSDWCEVNCADGCQGACASNCASDCSGHCDQTCEGSCDGSCDESCSGKCENDCTETCSRKCADDCSGNCTACTGTCSGKCDNACTAEGRSEAIASLGLSRILIGEEVAAVKAAIENEFVRRGRAYSNPYLVPAQRGKRVREEHGRKILEDCYAMDSGKDWAARIESGKGVKKADLEAAIAYIQTLATEILTK